MSVSTLIAIALVFGAVTALVYGLLLGVSPRPTQKRLHEATGTRPYGGSTQDPGAAWMVTVARITGPFARLSLPSTGWEQSPLRRSFLHAGLRGQLPITVYFGSKTLLALGLPALVYLPLATSGTQLAPRVMLLVLFALAAIGYYAPNLVLQQLIRRRQRELFESFPDATDLMLVCVESGLGLDSAMARVADEVKLRCVPLAQELHLVNLEVQAGGSREGALRNLALRTGLESIETFSTMLIQADRFGTSIGDSLRVFSDELRTKRQLAAEERAAKIPLKLLFPLVFFIFPSMLLVLLGPAFIQIYRILLPALRGGA